MAADAKQFLTKIARKGKQHGKGIESDRWNGRG